MKLENTQTLSQKITLSPAMRQALECLQLPMMQLHDYVQEAALENPVLEVAAPAEELSPDREQTVEYREQSLWYSKAAPEEGDALSLYTREETFCEYLHGQIGQMRLIDDSLRPLCSFLVDCLDRRGYLDCPLDELAAEYGCETALMEQALYAVQMLDPPGVGARDLTECLILQLMQSRAFNELTLHIAREGLDLLAAGDYEAIAQRFGATREDVLRSAAAIRGLSPIPSRGFPGDELISYSIPEAEVAFEDGVAVITMNERLLPRLELSEDYRQMMQETTDSEVQQYLKQKFAEAGALSENLRSRSRTLLAVLTAAVNVQRGYFLEGVLQPFTMQQLAGQLGLSTSTVSRAVQDKTIQYAGRIIPLRSLFTTPIHSKGGASLSAQAVKQQLQAFLQAEDVHAPLSDDALCSALEAVGMSISRRTVAKYRAELGYDIASRRKKK